MRHREFWSLVDEVLGQPYGRAVVADQVLGELEGMTAVQALDAGIEPRDVWHALCDALDVPEPQRWGKDDRHPAPPRSR